MVGKYRVDGSNGSGVVDFDVALTPVEIADIMYKNVDLGAVGDSDHCTLGEYVAQVKQQLVADELGTMYGKLFDAVTDDNSTHKDAIKEIMNLALQNAYTSLCHDNNLFAYDTSIDFVNGNLSVFSPDVDAEFLGVVTKKIKRLNVVRSMYHELRAFEYEKAEEQDAQKNIQNMVDVENNLTTQNA